MPSPDRPKPQRDRSEPEGTSRDRERARMHDAPIEPPQYFDPAEPWDSQSAEALVRLYESGEGYLHRRPGDERTRRQPPHSQAAVPPSGEPSAGRDTARLEARLAEIAERLQGSLAEINPDKAVSNLNRRLDAIEERFNEALSQVVQRSDLDGLKLIEAHVMELAAHVEQTRGRLDRIDAIDNQMQGLVQRLEAGDHQRLDALERLLQDYIAEWRRSDERTAGVLHNLEGVVSRVGESIEAMEAQKPAPDLSLALLGTPGLGEPSVESDPLSQVYADAARVLEPSSHRAPLDAADYAPKTEPESEIAGPRQPTPVRETKPVGEMLPSPAFLVSIMRNKLRQALGVDRPGQPDRKAASAGGADPTPPPARRNTRPNLLLTGAITVFAAAGYLLVDTFMTTSAATRRSTEAEQSAGQAGNQVVAASSTLVRAGERSGEVSREEAPAASSATRIEAIASAMAAAFHPKDEAARSPVASTASIHKGILLTADEAAAPTPVMAALPMTIGPASLRQAAMRGEAAAQMEIASRFAAGQGVERDLQQAFQWYGRAAAQGLAVAQYRFAALYERGLGTARDAERARVWYARAAEQGNVKAMHNLAVLTVSGGRSDYAAAAKWFTLAADFGLTDSQVNLAILYQNGLGVPKDLTRTYKWLTLAARGGDREAAARVAQIKPRLSIAELEAADAMIAAWRARTPDTGVNETVPAPTLDLSQ